MDLGAVTAATALLVGANRASRSESGRLVIFRFFEHGQLIIVYQ
jgi:hypothetical protein